MFQRGGREKGLVVLSACACTVGLPCSLVLGYIRRWGSFMVFGVRTCVRACVHAYLRACWSNRLIELTRRVSYHTSKKQREEEEEKR